MGVTERRLTRGLEARFPLPQPDDRLVDAWLRVVEVGHRQRCRPARPSCISAYYEIGHQRLNQAQKNL